MTKLGIIYNNIDWLKYPEHFPIKRVTPRNNKFMISMQSDIIMIEDGTENLNIPVFLKHQATKKCNLSQLVDPKVQPII